MQNDFEYLPFSKKGLKKVLGVVRISLLMMFVAVFQMSATSSSSSETTFSVNENNLEQPQQAKRQISGTVLDDSGEPVIGANVVEKGTTNGIITNADGKFTLNVGANAVLQVTYIGYVAQEVAVGNQQNVTITLSEDTQALEEVVVIGYGVVKKSDLTGSVSSVSNKQFKDQPIVRVEDALQGRMAGVEVTSIAGAPGGDVKIRVRGTTSINKGNDPLYVVDGIVRETGLSGINTDDIQSIEVLKDASSTAIYGSRGANGVVLISTRKGSEGKPQLNVDAQVGISVIGKRYDMLSAYEYATALNDISGIESFSSSDLAAYKSGARGIDWQDELLQTGISQNYKLNFSGGNNTTRYFISGNVLDQEGIVITTGYKRYQFRTNVDTKITPWLNVTSDLSVSRSESHNNNIYSGGKGNILWTALNYSPTIEMKDENGKYYRDPINNANGENPVGNLRERDSDNLSNFVNGNLVLRFDIIKGLTFSVQGGFNFRNSKGYGFQSTKAFNTNSMSNNDGQTFTWQNTNNLTYTNTFGDHSITLMGVYEASQAEWRNMGISGTNLLTESVRYWNVGIASSRSESNSFSAQSMSSWLGRLMYSYKGRYLLTGTFRADGSSKFQGDNKWGYFPSGALAWNVAEEDFMKENGLFQQMKLRASAGVIGNQAIGAYETLGMLSGNSYSYGTTTRYTGYWANSFSSPDLTWEKTVQYDIGADFSVLNQRINVSFDWFLKQTKDILLQKSIPGYNGGGNFWVNQGEVKNTGVELSVNAFPVRGKLTWESTFNASYLKNEVVDLAGDPYLLGQTPASGLVEGCTILQPGYPVGSFFLYQWDGFDSNGNNIYHDYNNNGVFDSGDKTIVGKANPDWTFGWNNMVYWKNWEFNIFLNAAVGLDKLNITRFTMASQVGDSRFITLRDSYYKNWDMVSNKADAQFPSARSGSNVYRGESTMWLENANFLKVRNISVAYNIPKSVSKVADIRLSLSCQNALTITGYKGMDPEAISIQGSTDINNGMDAGAYPTPRIFTVGAKITF